ncbi:MAG: sulfatase-like hydrolase/transferase [Elusimicrobiota bacterium]
MREKTLHLFVLSALACAQPLYDLLARHADFFVARRAGTTDILILIFLLSCMLPAVLALIALLASRLDRRLGEWTHSAAVAALAGLLALQIGKHLGASSSLLLFPAAALAGAGAARLLHNNGRARTYLSFLSPAVLIIPAAFLLASQIRPLVFGGGGAAAPLSSGGKKYPNIVFVIYDALPTITLMNEQRLIDAERFPNFARLANDSVWFRNATTIAPVTFLSVPVAVSGIVHPFGEKVPIATHHAYPRNLFTFLADSHAMNAWETYSILCPEKLCGDPRNRPPFVRRLRAMLTDLSIVYLHLVLPGDLTARLPAVTRTWKNFSRPDDDAPAQRPSDEEQLKMVQENEAGWKYEDRPRDFLAFVDSIRPGPRPTLNFLHHMLPHPPWNYLASGKYYTVPGEQVVEGVPTDTDRWPQDEFIVRRGFQRHLMQTIYTDKLLGRLLDRLEKTGLYDDTLIVVTADHGVSFRAGDLRREWTSSNVGDIMAVPLFFKLPGRRAGRISDRNVENIDIIATIADAIGKPLPWPRGPSALDEKKPARPEKLILIKGAAVRRYPPHFPEMNQALDQQVRRFGTSANPEALFRVGPHGGLVGRAVSKQLLAEPARVGLEIDQRDRAFLTGRIVFGSERPRLVHLAFALNGVIRAVTRTRQPANGAAALSVLLPEERFLPDGNELQVFVISGDAGREKLRPLRQR